MGVKFLVVFDIRRIAHIFPNSIGLSRSKNKWSNKQLLKQQVLLVESQQGRWNPGRVDHLISTNTRHKMQIQPCLVKTVKA